MAAHHTCTHVNVLAVEVIAHIWCELWCALWVFRGMSMHEMVAFDREWVMAWTRKVCEFSTGWLQSHVLEAWGVGIECMHLSIRLGVSTASNVVI